VLTLTRIDPEPTGDEHNVREDRSGDEVVIELDELGDVILDLRSVCQHEPAADVAERHLSKMADAAPRAASPAAVPVLSRRRTGTAAASS